MRRVEAGGETASWVDRFRKRRAELDWWRALNAPALISGSRRSKGRMRVPPTRIEDLRSDLVPTLGQEFKVVVQGSVGVGKSALLIQFIQNAFVEDYDPTIEDSYRKQITVNNVDVLIDVLDTAEQEEYSALIDRYERSGDVFILVYSATSMASFCALNHFYEQAYRVMGHLLPSDLLPMVLVENKIDLVDEREVPKGAGERAAKALGCLFVSASAKTRDGVDDVFRGAVKLCLAVRAELAAAAAVDQRRQQEGRAPPAHALSALLMRPVGLDLLN